MNLNIIKRMHVVTYTLAANGLCPDEQQSFSLSGYNINEFKQDLRPELSHVLRVRLADLWPLTIIPLRSKGGTW